MRSPCNFVERRSISGEYANFLEVAQSRCPSMRSPCNFVERGEDIWGTPRRNPITRILAGAGGADTAIARRDSSTTLSYLLSSLPIGARRRALCHATAPADVTSCRSGTCGPHRYSVGTGVGSARPVEPQHTSARSLGRAPRPWRILLCDPSARFSRSSQAMSPLP